MNVQAHDARIDALSFGPDGTLLASGSWDRVAKLWDVRAGTLKREFPRHPDIVHAVAFSTKEPLFATGCFDANIRIWDLSQEHAPPRILEGHGMSVDRVFFSLDGRALISTSGDRSVRVWDVITGQQRCVLGRHSARVFAACLSADGATLATGSWDGTIHLWRAAIPGEVGTAGW